jgi:hypothetical protein
VFQSSYSEIEVIVGVVSVVFLFISLLSSLCSQVTHSPVYSVTGAVYVEGFILILPLTLHIVLRCSRHFLLSFFSLSLFHVSFPFFLVMQSILPLTLHIVLRFFSLIASRVISISFNPVKTSSAPNFTQLDGQKLDPRNLITAVSNLQLRKRKGAETAHGIPKAPEMLQQTSAGSHCCHN